jgi:hypothetical protein
MLIAAIAYLIAFAIPVKFHFIIDLLIRSTVFTLLFLLPVYFFRISSDLNQAEDNFLRKIKIIR